MILLFSDKKSKCEEEIIEILKKYGGNYISNKTVYSQNGSFTIISINKPVKIETDTGIAVILDKCDKFNNQDIPCGFIGVCENNNKNALQIIKKNNLPVICCGMNPKSTITFSSMEDNIILASLQRTIMNIKFKKTEPTDFKIKLDKNYNPFSVMASLAILLLNDISPDKF